MNVVPMTVKDGGAYNTAPLRNLTLLEGLLNQATSRANHLPGLVTFSGPSGFGKSTAAAYVASKHSAYYMEVRSTWKKKPFLEMMLRQMGIPAQKTIFQMTNQVSEELAVSQKPLILDEFDNAIDCNLVEIVRDIYAQSLSPIVLIGEENLPQKLQRWERFHGRVLAWGQAQPANIEDARHLNKHYTPDIHVHDDLLMRLVGSARGSIRRIVTNLDRIASFARAERIDTIGLQQWGERELHGSRAPAARSF
jgi:DNA transposition AAA+ family ATPase